MNNKIDKPVLFHCVIRAIGYLNNWNFAVS